MKNNAIKRIGTELLKYRKKQYLLLQILICILSFVETCITVVMFNESVLLSDGETFSVAITGICILLCLFSITFYCIVYVNFYIDKGNFEALLKCGFTKKELVKSIKVLGQHIFLKYLLIGGVTGTTIGLLLTWRYKQAGSILISGMVVIIIYFISQRALKGCIKRVFNPVKIKGEKEYRQKIKLPEKIRTFDVSIKYMIFSSKRVISVSILVFICGFLISYSLSMIKSISLEKFISDIWGDADYKVTLYKEGDITGNYYSMQMDNPLTEEMRQNIMKIQGITEVTPYYSVQAVFDNNGEETETCIEEFNEDIKSKAKTDNINDGEIVISTRTATISAIKKLLKKNDSISIDFFDGNEVKNKVFKVKEIIVDDSKTTMFYASKQSIEKMLTKGSPILSFYIYGEEKQEIYSEISEIIAGKTLELEDMNSFVTETKEGFELIKIGIVAIMIILMVFSVSVLISTKFLNIIVSKNSFQVLQTLGMTHKEIKKIILIEELISSLPMIILSWITGLKMCDVTCNYMIRAGSIFWLYKPAYDSLIVCGLLLLVIFYIEFKVYKYIVEK